MPWVETCVVDQRVQFVADYYGGSPNISALCRKYGISRKTGHKWLNRFAEAGSVESLCDRSRRPRRSPRRTPPEIEAQVIALRRRYPWGGRKLQVLLQRRGIELPRITIDRIVKRAGLVRGEDTHRRATKRFERQKPNQTWQVDFKGQYPLADGRECFPLTMLDDCSRYCLSLDPHTDQRTESVWSSFVSAFRSCGVPEQILFDRGVPWYATTSDHGLTRLGVQLIRQGIELIFGSPYHPQTRGKVERCHRSLANWLDHRGRPTSLSEFRRALKVFREDYNKIRPHEALEMQTPASRWVPSGRPFRPQPPDWEYPAGSIVRRVSAWGAIAIKGRTYFVCEALVGESVRCQELDSTLLVTYRHMIVREIDLTTGQTRPIIRPERKKV